MREVTVQELWTYPIKSCQGVPAPSIEIGELGVVGDRAFAIWSDGQLVEQKHTPRVAAIAAELDETADLLTLRHREHGLYEHEVVSDGSVRRATWISDSFDTIDQGDDVAGWLGAVLEREVRLVAPGQAWAVDLPSPLLAPINRQPRRSFAAAAPVGLANRASLDDLNTRLDHPVPMDRFRVNVVVEGLDPYAEDEIVSVGNDDVELLNVASAERCVIITTDQRTGERPANNLMQVLAGYRKKPAGERFASGLKFGNYMTVGRAGTIAVGDRLMVA